MIWDLRFINLSNPKLIVFNHQNILNEQLEKYDHA